MFSPWSHHDDGRCSNIFLICPQSPHLTWTGLSLGLTRAGMYHMYLPIHPISLPQQHWGQIIRSLKTCLLRAHEPYMFPLSSESLDARRLVRRCAHGCELRATGRRSEAVVGWWWAESTGGGAHRGNLWPVPDHWKGHHQDDGWDSDSDQDDDQDRD